MFLIFRIPRRFLNSIFNCIELLFFVIIRSDDSIKIIYDFIFTLASHVMHFPDLQLLECSSSGSQNNAVTFPFGYLCERKRRAKRRVFLELPFYIVFSVLVIILVHSCVLHRHQRNLHPFSLGQNQLVVFIVTLHIVGLRMDSPSLVGSGLKTILQIPRIFLCRFVSCS